MHSGRAFGAIVGPIAGGALSEALGLPWTTTIFAFITIIFVRNE